MFQKIKMSLELGPNIKCEIQSSFLNLKRNTVFLRTCSKSSVYITFVVHIWSRYLENWMSILLWISLKCGLDSASYFQQLSMRLYISSGVPSGAGIRYPESNISRAFVFVIPATKERLISFTSLIINLFYAENNHTSN